MHTPESLASILNDSLQSPTDRKRFLIEGIYSDRKGRLYGHTYYDRIIDTSTDRELTLRVPKNVKPLLIDSVRYRFSGFLNHAIQGGQDLLNIGVNFHVLKVEGDRGKQSNEENGQAELLVSKSENGFKDSIKTMHKREFCRRLLGSCYWECLVIAPLRP